MRRPLAVIALLVILPSFLYSQSHPLSSAKTWSQRTIRTGVATGIMIQYIGMKPGKRTAARTANIEVWRYPLDTAVVNNLTLPIASEKATRITAAINSLNQAFFRVPPGTYLVRHTEKWAEETLVRHVEVKDRSYSVISIQILNPRRTKSAQASP